jgi:hypothetical protein
MKFIFSCTRFIFLCLLFTACKSNSNERAVNLEDLDKVTAAEQQEAPGPARSTLTAKAFIELSACTDLPCVQLFMKDRSSDFVHAKKGEFASQYRSAVTDTTGNSLVIPMSTLYVTVDAGADWRMAHTVHSKALSDQLLQEFAAAKFLLTDSSYSNKSAGFIYRYRSVEYPGLVLSQTKTFAPWRARGLYYTVTWPCYVFELYATE